MSIFEEDKPIESACIGCGTIFIFDPRMVRECARHGRAQDRRCKDCRSSTEDGDFWKVVCCSCGSAFLHFDPPERRPVIGNPAPPQDCPACAEQLRRRTGQRTKQPKQPAQRRHRHTVIMSLETLPCGLRGRLRVRMDSDGKTEMILKFPRRRFVEVFDDFDVALTEAREVRRRLIEGELPQRVPDVGLPFSTCP